MRLADDYVAAAILDVLPRARRAGTPMPLDLPSELFRHELHDRDI
jgi:hypothetical protein